MKTVLRTEIQPSSDDIGLKECSLSDCCTCFSKCSVTMIHFKSKWNFSLRMTYAIIFVSDSMYLRVYAFPSVYALNCLQQEQPRKRNSWELCVLCEIWLGSAGQCWQNACSLDFLEKLLSHIWSAISSSGLPSIRERWSYRRQSKGP